MAITKIAQVDVGSGGAASISFSAIAGTFTDLMVTFSGRNTSGGNDFALLRLNSTTTGYSWRWLRGTGSAVSSTDSTAFGGTTGHVIGLTGGTNMTADTFSNAAVYIPNYTSAVAKTLSSDSVTENNAANPSEQIIIAGASTLTSAVTSLTIVGNTGTNFAQYSSASLYGISNSGATGATVS